MLLPLLTYKPFQYANSSIRDNNLQISLPACRALSFDSKHLDQLKSSQLASHRPLSSPKIYMMRRNHDPSTIKCAVETILDVTLSRLVIEQGFLRGGFFFLIPCPLSIHMALHHASVRILAFLLPADTDVVLVPELGCHIACNGWGHAGTYHSG